MIRYVKFGLLLFNFLLLQFSVVKATENQLWEQIKNLKQKSLDIFYTNLDSADWYVDSALSLVEPPIDTTTCVSLYNLKANIIFRQGEYYEALNYYLKSIELIEENENFPKPDLNRQREACFYNMATVYYYIDNFEMALNYLARAESINQKLDSANQYVSRINNLQGLIFYEKDQYDSALYYFNHGLRVLKNDTANEKTKVSQINLTNNMALVYSELGQAEKAIAYYSKGLRHYEAKKEYVNLSWSYCRLADQFIKLNKQEESWHYLQLADKVAQISSTLETKKDITYSYLQFYLQFGSKEQLKNALDRYISIKDSIVDLKIQKNTQEVEAKFQVEKQAADLAFSRENNARLAAENSAQHILLTTSLVGIGVMFLLFFFGYRSYHQKRKIHEMELEIKDNKLDELMSNYESAAFAAMLEGQEKERDRIAQDLHDRLGGTLAALKLALRRPDNKVAAEDLSIVDEAVGEVRAIAHNLSSGLLKKYGLNEALQHLTQSIERTAGLKFSLYLYPAVSGFSQTVSLELYRMVQELLNNTLKHADANEISLQTNISDDIFNLIFEDNGKGFDVENVKSGLGLINLQKRAEKINAKLNIDSKKGRGTIVIIELKIKHLNS